MSDVARARTLLFVPGTRPERFAKAVASGADGIVLDLEDAVAPAAKDEARDAVCAWLDAGGAGTVRINGPDSAWHDDDVRALRGRVRSVLLPKATRAAAESVVRDLRPADGVIAILESAAGILDAREICAVPGVVRAAFGNGDLAAELGVDHADLLALAHARAAVVLASAAAGVAPPLDGVTTALDDDQRLVADVRHAAALGFTGKMCIHPRQVAPVHAVLAPSAADVAWAEQVLAAGSDDGVTTVAGRMVDKPVVERARAVLARAGSPS